MHVADVPVLVPPDVLYPVAHVPVYTHALLVIVKSQLVTPAPVEHGVQEST